MKTDDELDRLLYGTTPVHIWEMMVKKRNLEKVLEGTPDDFRAWVRMKAADILSEWHNIHQVCITSYNGIAIRNKPKTRKDWAKWIGRTTYPNILFNILDGKDNWEPIMEIVKPKLESPFKQKTDS